MQFLNDLIPFVGIGLFTFEVLIGAHFFCSVSSVHFFQLFFGKPAGGGELDVYHEEGWMPGKTQ
jgi:hypothetical protein